MGRHKSIRKTLQTSGLTPLLKVSGKAGCLKPLKVPGVPHISTEKQHGLQAAVGLCISLMAADGFGIEKLAICDFLFFIFFFLHGLILFPCRFPHQSIQQAPMMTGMNHLGPQGVPSGIRPSQILPDQQQQQYLRQQQQQQQQMLRVSGC